MKHYRFAAVQDATPLNVPIMHSSPLLEKMNPCFFQSLCGLKQKPLGHELKLSIGLHPLKPKSAAAGLFNSIRKASPAPSCREQVKPLAESNHILLLLSELGRNVKLNQRRGGRVSYLCAFFRLFGMEQTDMNKPLQQARRAIHELQLLDPGLIFILIDFFSAAHTARSTCKKKKRGWCSNSL